MPHREETQGGLLLATTRTVVITTTVGRDQILNKQEGLQPAPPAAAPETGLKRVVKSAFA